MISAPEFLHEGLMVKLKYQFDKLRATCEPCKGTGRIITSIDDNTFKDCEHCTGRINRLKEYMEANVKDEHINLTLSDTKTTYTPQTYKNFSDILSKIVKIVSKYSLILYRYNDEFSYGTGTAASIIIRQLIDKDFKTYCIDFLEFLDCMFNFGEEAEINSKRSQLLEYLTSVPVLWIDNFGCLDNGKNFSVGSFSYKKVCTFLNLRKMHGYFTLISTDLTRDIFRGNYIGSLTAMIDQHFLPFEIQCNTGKGKHSAIAKLGKEDPELAGLFADFSQKQNKGEL